MNRAKVEPKVHHRVSRICSQVGVIGTGLINLIPADCEIGRAY